MSHDSIRGCVCSSVRPLVGRSVRNTFGGQRPDSFSNERRGTDGRLDGRTDYEICLSLSRNINTSHTLIISNLSSYLAASADAVWFPDVCGCGAVSCCVGGAPKIKSLNRLITKTKGAMTSQKRATREKDESSAPFVPWALTVEYFKKRLMSG